MTADFYIQDLFSYRRKVNDPLAYNVTPSCMWEANHPASPPAAYQAPPNLSNWMSRLDQSIPFNEISLPGAHNALSYNNACVPTSTWDPSTAAVNAKVQAQSSGGLAEYLLDGIRYFDLRFAWNRGIVCGHYKNFTCGENSLMDVISAVYSFVKNNPSEIVLLHVSCTDQQTSGRVFGAMKDFFGSLIIPSNTNLTSSLGQMRSKGNILLISSTVDQGCNCPGNYADLVYPSSALWSPQESSTVVNTGALFLGYINKIYSSQVPSGPLTLLPGVAVYPQDNYAYSRWSDSQRINPAISGNIGGPEAPIAPPKGRSKHGVVMVDYYQNGNIPLAIVSLNHGK